VSELAQCALVQGRWSKCFLSTLLQSWRCGWKGCILW